MKLTGTFVLKSLVLGVLLNAGFLFSQVSSTYSFSQEQGQYQELQNSTVLATATGVYMGSLDTDKIKVDLPFSFTFNGTSYSHLHIYPKGYVSFGDAYIGVTTSPISFPGRGGKDFEGVISVFGSDILSSYDEVSGKASTIAYEVFGMAPNREIVFQWKHFRFYAQPLNANEDFNFQLKLNENGEIRFVYDVKNVNTWFSEKSVQVGLRGTSNADFNNRLATGASGNDWNSTVQGVARNSSVKTNGNLPLPASGLTFIYTPAQLSAQEVKVDTAEKIVEIAPNPVANILKIETKENLQSCEIFNVAGQKILSAEGKTIDVSHLSKGNYIVKINLKGGKSITKKFIKK